MRIASPNSNESPTMASETRPARDWSKILAPYRDPKTGRSIFEIVVTVAPLLTLWAIAWALHARGWWWASLLLTIPAAFFLVRLFMIQHDCGHGAFFRTRAINDWVGRLFGVFTLTPYDYWKRTHAAHHAAAGNLDRRSDHWRGHKGDFKLRSANRLRSTNPSLVQPVLSHRRL